MPAIKVINQVTAANAANGLQFNTIGPNGAFITLVAAGVTAGDIIGLTVGGKPVVNAGQTNIEISADVCDTGRDVIIEREPVPPGEIFLPVTAATALNWLLIIEDAPPGALTF